MAVTEAYRPARKPGESLQQWHDRVEVELQKATMTGGPYDTLMALVRAVDFTGEALMAQDCDD